MGDKRLRIAIVAALAELAVQLVVLVGSGTLGGAPLRVVFLLSKAPICALALRRHAGAFLALWVFEIGALVAVVGGDGRALPRIGFGLAALVVMALLGRATSAFPPVEWQSR